MRTPPPHQSSVNTPATPDSPSDSEIVERVLAGETTLFELIIRRYNQRLYRTVRAILANDGDIDDVMQQAYINAYTHLGQFAGRSSFSTWLTKIAINQARARRRPRRSNFVDAQDEDTLRDLRCERPNPEEQLLSEEFSRALDAGIDSLPDSYRAVLELRQIDGMTTSAVAARLGVHNDVVKTRLYRARRAVKSNISARFGDPHIVN